MQCVVVYISINSGKLEYITSIHFEVTAHGNATESAQILEELNTTNHAH